MVFENISCEAASPLKPIQQPGSDDVMIDTSMFVFYTSAVVESTCIQVQISSLFGVVWVANAQ